MSGLISNKEKENFFESRGLNLNGKEIPIGSVGYYVKKRGNDWRVDFGIVKEHYVSAIGLQLVELADRMLINGIPRKEFETPTVWKKLPKGYSYNTKLFEISFLPLQEELKNRKIENPDDILWLYENGIFVNVQDNDHAKIEAEISKENGWRIIRKYDKTEKCYISVNCHEVYTTYEDAQRVVDDYYAELERQANLSDYDWSVEQIDRVLDMWAKRNGISDKEKKAYRDWILEREKVEDIEVRSFSDEIQWKYYKNKRWMNIEL